VFKKFLSATKNKIKTPPHIKMNGGGAGMSSLEDDEEFEARKHEWQVRPKTFCASCCNRRKSGDLGGFLIFFILI